MMKKPIINIFVFLILFLGFFEFYIFYLYPQEISPSGYFSGILATIIGEKSDKSIRVNLYSQTITLFENGDLVKQAKIAAAGHPRSTPTPQGSFKILSKEKRHISTLSGLVMPLSLRFYKGYFFHGIPLTRSGYVVSTVYSNGCIRLGPGLDQEIFNWADVGTKVQVYSAQLVKSIDDPMVYFLTKDGFKEPIANEEIFNSRGYKWKDVITIPLLELEAFPQADSLEA